MGYRSDIEVIVSNEGYSVLKNFILSQADEYNKKYPNSGEQPNILEFADNIQNKETYTHIYFSYLKYYEDFPEVQIFENALDFLEKNGYSIRFAMIGEDLNDNTVRYCDGEKDANVRIPHLWISRSFSSEL